MRSFKYTQGSWQQGRLPLGFALGILLLMKPSLLYPEPVWQFPCILLAAGASSRMNGTNKMLLPLGEKPVLRYLAETILSATRPLIIVTGSVQAEFRRILEGLPEVIFTHNADWQRGMVSSAQTGIRTMLEAGDFTGFFLHHGDIPFVTDQAFSVLASEFHARQSQGVKETALVSAFHGRNGHPVLFPASYASAILRLGDGERLKSVLLEHGSVSVETGCEGVLEDMDTKEDYEALREKYLPEMYRGVCK